MTKYNDKKTRQLISDDFFIQPNTRVFYTFILLNYRKTKYEDNFFIENRISPIKNFYLSRLSHFTFLWTRDINKSKREQVERRIITIAIVVRGERMKY